MTRGVFNPINSKTETHHHPAGGTCHHFELYRLSCDHYDDMRDRAGRACEICRIPDLEAKGGGLVIDHFHPVFGWEFPYIRGLLCRADNSLMARVDGRMKWGANRTELEPLGLAYAANSWQMPNGLIRPRAVRRPLVFEQLALFDRELVAA